VNNTKSWVLFGTGYFGRYQRAWLNLMKGRDKAQIHRLCSNVLVGIGDLEINAFE
jgi:hypothetical protein